MRSLIIVALLALVLVSCKPDAEKLRAFEKWVRERAEETDGELNEKIALNVNTDFKQNRVGVVALQDLSKEDILGSFPLDFMISSKTLEFHEIGELLQKVHSRFADGGMYDPAYTESLALFLIYEKFIKQDQSEYKPWIDILPEISEMSDILFWTSAEIKYLEGSPMQQRAMDRRKEVRERWEWLEVHIFGPYDRIWTREIKEDMYKWAIAITRSRNKQIVVNHGESFDIYEPALVPFFDSFHHIPMSEDELFFAYDQMDKLLTVRSEKDFKAGDEVLVSYGEKCNSELLDFYGYIIEDNPNDCVHVELEISRNDPIFNEKAIIHRARYTDPAQLKFLKQGLTAELLRSVRLITLQPEMITNGMLMKGLPDESLGTFSDYLVADYLLKKLRLLYTNYPPEDKEVDLEDPNLPPRKKLALQLKQGEKKVIEGLGTHFFREAERLAEILSQEQHDEL